MQRLHARDAENGAIDGLIASNVGDSTLAVINFYNFYNSLKSLLCKYEYLLQMLDLDGLDYMVCISLNKCGHVFTVNTWMLKWLSGGDISNVTINFKDYKKD